MPDFDFDAFNHDEAEYDGDGNFVPRVQATVTSETQEAPEAQLETSAPTVETEPDQEIDPSTITEKKPLEARDTHASQGDNLSGEEVDKW